MDNVQEWQRDTTQLWSTDPKTEYTRSEEHKTWLILTFVILWAKKITLYIWFLCLLGGIAASNHRIKPFLMQSINNIPKLSLTRKLLYLFMSDLCLAFPWTVSNTVP